MDTNWKFGIIGILLFLSINVFTQDIHFGVITSSITISASSNLNVSNCINSDYTSFANATPTGFDAVSNGGGIHEAGTADEISMTSGLVYIVEFDMVLNSGTVPLCTPLTACSGAGNYVTVEESTTPANGYNYFEFEADVTTTASVVFLCINHTTDFEITNLSVRLK